MSIIRLEMTPQRKVRGRSDMRMNKVIEHVLLLCADYHGLADFTNLKRALRDADFLTLTDQLLWGLGNVLCCQYPSSTTEI